VNPLGQFGQVDALDLKEGEQELGKKAQPGAMLSQMLSERRLE
jgi:hypothetical protein